MSKSEYRNASDVLPESLIDEIRKYYPVGNLWIPSANGRSKKNQNRIQVAVMEAKGFSVNKIAKELGMTIKAVNECIKNLMRS